MKKIINLAEWNRREHVEFFSQCSEPFHSVVVHLDCSAAYQHCKTYKKSFFLLYLHQILLAINATESMRYRIENGEVVDFDVIHANATIGRADHTFGFCPINFERDIEIFVSEAEPRMQAVRNSNGLCFNDECKRLDVIHFSAIPWMSFSSITHARRFDVNDSIPKISVGKIFQQADKWMMPVATFVHHGLADAYHIHQFLDHLQRGLQSFTFIQSD
ncbi:CatA-like O-acetyltransferase [Undibacterium sp. SXout7W]|uniref:CatA-like O-acetyltransferase n=1 Tax=Undibacterium sp. SXout7W TaxID=3413049 RepID=UPI003BF024BF